MLTPVKLRPYGAVQICIIIIIIIIIIFKPTSTKPQAEKLG